MRAGDRRHMIVIKSPVKTQDGYGEETTTYTALATVRASVFAMSSREAFYAQQERGEVVYEFRFLNAPPASSVNETCIIEYGGLKFDIEPPLTLDRERTLLVRGTVKR